MRCDEAKNLIQLYMDDELDPCNTLQVQRHLEDCSSCSHLLETFMLQDRLLREAARSETASGDHLRRRILDAIRDQRPKAGWLSGWRRAAAVLILIGTGSLIALRIMLPANGTDVYAAAISDHRFCSKRTDVTLTQKELDQLMGSLVHLKRAPDLSSLGYTALRGRSCKLYCDVKKAEAQFLHLVFYGSGREPLSIFLAQHPSKLVDGEVGILPKGDNNVALIPGPTFDMIVVSPLDQKQTWAVVQTITEQLQSGQLTNRPEDSTHAGALLSPRRAPFGHKRLFGDLMPGR
jgi:hypothetical protein